MSIFAGGIEIKRPTTHVEAAISVILGRGFNSLRLHSTRRLQARDGSFWGWRWRDVVLARKPCRVIVAITIDDLTGRLGVTIVELHCRYLRIF